MTTLSHADQRRLKLVIDSGHELELIWANAVPPSNSADVRSRDLAFKRLLTAITDLSVSTSENLRRLAFHTRNLSLEMTARHLATILVPFERLAGQALRDDQILIDEGDLELGSRNTAPLRVIADNLRSAFNVGAVLRTAECFGVEHVSLAGYTPTPDTAKTARTSLGTERSVSWSSDANVHDVIRQAKAEGYSVVALETANTAIPLEKFKWPAAAVLLLGNERFGLDRDVLELADHLVRIPMHGSKNSLNVGVACGIALATWRAQHDANVAVKRNDVTYTPIASFKTKTVHPYEAPRQAALDISGLEGCISIEGLPTDTLKDLDGFDRVWLIYDFHHNKHWKPLVRPPRGPHVKRGVFATRSPYRPNAIGLSCVELLKVEGSTLTVRSTDLLDGTPILDIKPYISYADSFPMAKQGWLQGLDDTKFVVRFTENTESKLKWLEEKGSVTIRQFLIQQLEFDPLDHGRKRVGGTADDAKIAFRTWRANFQIHDQEILVSNLTSGYSAEDLEISSLDISGGRDSDRHGDKHLHRQFVETFGL